MDANLQKEITQAILKLKGVSKAASRASRRALVKAAGPFLEEVQFRAPVSDEVHYRYDTPKVVKGIRAPKGSGVKIATYVPGNVERSFKVLPLRRAKNSVYVGPNADRSGKGIFSGTRTDGFYAFWQEFGAPNAGIPPRPFIMPAWLASKGEVTRTAVDQLKRAIERYAKEVAVK